MSYFFIYGNEDGTRIIEFDTAEELINDVTNPEYRYMVDMFGKERKFSDRLVDFNYSSDVVIIKGEIVVPKPKKVVETYEIE